MEVSGTLVPNLVKPGTNLRFVLVEEMFSVLKSNHGGRIKKSMPMLLYS